jgi:hypothetical protein
MSEIHFAWTHPGTAERFRSGVSLHSHTSLSEESLDIIPRYTGKVPYLGNAIREQQQLFLERNGKPLDFARAYWTPPLSPRQAWDLESGQVQALGLQSFVSLSDHDNLQAAYQLRVLGVQAPVSLEWSVPFLATFFHVGVHNLPASKGHEIAGRLACYTLKPEPRLLTELLADLNAEPGVLLILNHPFWDESGLGEAEHAHALGVFLERHGKSLHALELNGLRPWPENRRVSWLARQTGMLLISGGDRHGREANSLINLTNATSFEEFVAEIRQDRQSNILFLPQQKETIRLRFLQTMWDIMRDYPDHPKERQHWSDRVFYRSDSGTAIPVSHYFTGKEPAVVKQFSRLIRLVESRRVQGVLRFALNDGEQALI